METIERVRYTVGSHRLAWRAARALREVAEQASDPDEVVEATASKSYGPTSVRPVQVRSELLDFLALVRSAKPQRVLEIGTAEGGMLFLLAWASSPGAHVLSLDIQKYDAARLRLYRGFGRRGQHLDVLHADSHLDDTRREVEKFFRDHLLDVLFIDGDHSYDGVREDYQRYSPLVRPGGLVAFHDIVEGRPETSGDVPRFWREIRSSLVEPLELVESWDQGGFGIGVGRAPAGQATRAAG
jgi:predicted O-methyltransferase YrrM